MAKNAILYRKDTLELDGIISLSQDSDLQFYPEHPETHGLIEVPLDHPVLHEQAQWRVQDGRLVKKEHA